MFKKSRLVRARQARAFKPYIQVPYVQIFAAGLLLFAGLALATPAAGQTFPLAGAVLDVDPGNLVDTGAAFRYRINYRCSSTVTDCQNVMVTYPMPPELVFVSALGTGDVASISTPGGGNNGPVTFTFNASVPAGNTGDLDITVRFPNGSTPDGTTATNISTAVGGNIPNSAAPPVDVTARAQLQPDLQKTIVGGQALLGFDTTYRLRIDADGGNGSLDLTGVRVVDTLPPGVVFISATNGGVYDPVLETVTWDNGGPGFNVPVGSALTLEVTVRFDDPPFTDGQMVTNTFDAVGTPLGGPPDQALGPVGLNHPVEAFVEDPDIRVDKRFGGGFVAPAIGQDFLYEIIIENNGNIDLDSLTVTDNVPVELQVISVTTGDYNNAAATVSVSFVTNLAGPTPLGSSPGNTNATFNIPVLAVGEYVTQVIWDLSGPVPVGMRPVNGSNRARLTARVIDPDNAGSPVVVGQRVENCVDGAYTATTMSGPVNGMESDCFGFDVSADFTLSSPRKFEDSSGPYLPGQIIDFRLDIDNQSQASDPLINPIVVDLLPPNLQYVPPFSLADNGTGMTVGLFEEIPNYQGTGRTLLRWSLTGTLDPGEDVDISFDTMLLVGAAAGTITNTVGQTHNDPTLLVRCTGGSSTDTLDLDGDGDFTDRLCTRGENITVAAVAQLESEKLVLGQCDVAFSKFPDNGITVQGGTLDYRLRVTNIGTVPTTNFVIVDILPFLGDTGVLDTNPRDTGWRPFLTGPIVPPPGAAVFYSTSGNPCRPEVGGPTSGCDAPNWSPTPPAPISDVGSFKIEFGALVLDPLDELVFDLRLVAPADAPIAGDLMNPVSGEIAWNSFAFGTDRVDGGFLNAEPLKVGVIVKPTVPAALGDFVWLDSNGDGVQNDGNTGINGVPVELYQPGPDGLPRTQDDVPVSSTITADDAGGLPGWYEFSGLLPGDYFVCFVAPINFDVTAPDQGGNDALDSDVDPGSLCTPITNLAPTEIDPTLDLGLLPPTTAALGNYVWFDRDGDGEQNEPLFEGVNGVTVRLYIDDGDGTPEPGADDGAPIRVTGTSDDGFGNPGFYLFENLVPGVPYFVEFVRPPVSFSFTTRDATGDTVDSDADPVSGTTPTVSLVAGEYNDTIDAGLIPETGPLSLGNFVWLDDNNDGLFDFGVESGTNGVRLNLFFDVNTDGQPQPNEFFSATGTLTQAGVAGRYLFDDLPAGNYIVEVAASNFDPGAPLSGRVTSTGNDPAPDPDDDQDSDDNGSRVGVLVLSQPISLSAGSEPTTEEGDLTGDDDSNLTVDFGFIPGVVIEEFDFGDAPDGSSGTERGDYRTTALDDGARHLQVPGQPFLGDCVDSDPGTQQNGAASADDLGLPTGGVIGVCGPGLDDEDGVTFASTLLIPNTMTTIDVRAAAGAPDCVLNAWIDWDRSGAFADAASEQIAADRILAAGTIATLNVAVPAGAVPGFTYARFRCASASGLAPTGLALDGEVEDYRLRVEGLDLGDAPDTYGTLSTSGGPIHDVDPDFPLYLGACVDTELDAPAPLDASGDDADLGLSTVGACLDDEDGVTFDTMLIACESASLTVTASLPGRLDAWIDFDGDGTFAGAGEQIATSQALVAGPNVLNITVPCAAARGITHSRFRFSTAGGLATGGPAVDGEVEDHAVLIKGHDRGDAPDSYATLDGSGGPRHGVDPNDTLYLGTCVDAELDGQPSTTADADDLAFGDGVAGTCTARDDEDGVAFTSMLIACQNASLTITAGKAGQLDAWIDFDGDGSFASPADQIFTNQSLVAGTNNLMFAVPCGVAPQLTYARFRLSSTGGLGFGGVALDGEVEDYLVRVKGADLGDAPDTFATLFGSGGARHGVDPATSLYLGTCVDTEVDGQPNAALDGDDLGSGTGVLGSCTAGDDEDGVSFTTLLIGCESASVDVTAGDAGQLDAWIDFDGDGTFTGAGEQIFANQALMAGLNNLNFTVPCAVAPGTRATRFRFSSAGGLNFDGPALDGEVEDHPVLLEGADLGDAPDSYSTLFVSNGPRHAVDASTPFHLGSCVDTDADGQPATGAADDDTGSGLSTVGTCTAGDDEDGVAFTSALVACEDATLTVTANLAGQLDAWIDFDGDGTFAGAGEQIFANQALAAGGNDLSFMVPCSAITGDVYARFRLSTAGGLSFDGPAADGEVEDYRLTTEESDFGDAPDSYQTSFQSDGPRHVLDPSAPWLGACVDSDPGGQPNAAADGDDVGPAIGLVGTLGSCATANDDEDGVGFDTLLLACFPADLTITATAPGVVDAWIDFDGDGTFNGPDDRILNGQAVGAGANPFTINVPCAAANGTTYARFRISTGGVSTFSGPAADGEVEDYVVDVQGLDYGDAPAPYPTQLADDGARHPVLPSGNPTLGAAVDTELDGQPSANHGGDDGGGIDDEDGVSLAGILVPGTNDQIELRTGATGGYVSAWIDWNLDGDWSDAGEQIVSDVLLGPGATALETFAVPVSAVMGTSCVRVRISSATGLTPTGAAVDGEIEDHAVALGIEEPRLGIAKEFRDVVREDTEDPSFLVTFDVRLENLGNVPLSDVGVIVDLASAFDGVPGLAVLSTSSATLTVDPAFDGVTLFELLAPGNILGVGESALIEMLVRVEPGFDPGPYFCSSIACGTSPRNTKVTDTSQDGPDTDPDSDGDPTDDNEPTPVTFPFSIEEIPTLGEWGLLVLIGLLMLVGVRRMRMEA